MKNSELVDELMEIKRKAKLLKEEEQEISKTLKQRSVQYGTEKIEGTLAVATIYTQERDSVAYGKLPDELKETLKAGGYVKHSSATILKLTAK